MTRADILIIALAAALVGVLVAYQFTPANTPDTVIISIGSQRYASLPLDSERRVDVHGRLGISVIEIADGRARFVSSPCTNKICVHSGWLSRSGEVAACLPNAVTIRLTGSQQEFDSINF